MTIQEDGRGRLAIPLSWGLFGAVGVVLANVVAAAVLYQQAVDRVAATSDQVAATTRSIDVVLEEIEAIKDATAAIKDATAQRIDSVAEKLEAVQDAQATRIEATDRLGAVLIERLNNQDEKLADIRALLRTRYGADSAAHQ